MDNDFLSLSGLFLKASPAEEAGKRVLYMVASSEATDLQGERVLAQSLQDSSEHFLKFGNLDLDHRTMLPPRVQGENPYLWEIGRPVDVQFNGQDTLVKAEIYQGEADFAKNANMVWESLTQVSPPARWYPSVGGQILERGTDLDPVTGDKISLVKRVRWTNIGLSRTPVNNALPSVSTVPVEQFCKSWNGAGFVCKALEAGCGTDSVTLTGGGALRRQSLEPQVQDYLSIRNGLAEAVQKRRVHASVSALTAYAVEQLGLPEARAVKWVGRFLRDLQHHRG